MMFRISSCVRDSRLVSRKVIALFASSVAICAIQLPLAWACTVVAPNREWRPLAWQSARSKGYSPSEIPALYSELEKRLHQHEDIQPSGLRFVTLGCRFAWNYKATITAIGEHWDTHEVVVEIVQAGFPFRSVECRRYYSPSESLGALSNGRWAPSLRAEAGTGSNTMAFASGDRPLGLGVRWNAAAANATVYGAVAGLAHWGVFSIRAKGRSPR